MIFLEILLENPFIFTFIFITLFTCLVLFIFLQTQNPSNDEAVLFSAFGRPLIGFVFVFVSIVSLLYFFTKFSAKMASEESFLVALGWNNSAFQKNANEKDGKSKKSDFVPIKLGEKKTYKAGWIDSPSQSSEKKSEVNSEKSENINQGKAEEADKKHQNKSFNDDNYPTVVALNL